MKKQLLIISALFLSIGAIAQWTPQATGFATPNRGVRNICAIDANTVWIAAYDGGAVPPAIPANVQDFSKTLDGGNTWQPGVVNTAPSTFNWSNISAISSTTAWACFYQAVGASGGGGIFKTTDGGATWIQQGSGSIYGAGSFPDFVHFWDANNGVAVGDPNGPGTTFYEIYTTANGGSTWTRTPTTNIPAKSPVAEAAILNNFCVVGNTMWFGTSAGRCYKSIDKGLNWTVSVISSVNTDEVIEVVFSTPSDGIAIVADNAGTIFTTYKSTNGGTNWTMFTPASGTFYTTGDLIAIPNSNAFVSTGALPTVALGSSYSLDGGDNWIDIDLGVQHTALGFVDGTTGWTGGFNTDNVTEGISKYNGIVLGVTALNNDNARMRLFPNPSNGQFRVQIGGAETKDALITIVDVVGSLVLKGTIPNKSNVVEKGFDITGIAKGVYFVNVVNGTTRFCDKLIVE